jgi:acid phosphatase
VVVVMENRAYRDLLGARNAPYINALARSGATFSRSFALTHPSEPNYLALFSGSTHHVFGDPCPLRLGGPNLASELMDAGLSFGGYSEGLPRKGSRVCVAGRYARKHVPWVNFHAVPRGVSKPFTRFPDDYSALPDVSFVIPDLCHDMHDCSIATGDQWLRRHMRAYAAWAQAHSSLLVLTWDEDDGSSNNHILTAIAGAGVMPGRYPEKIDHYSVLRTIEDMYGLGHAGHAAEAQPIADIWR